MKSDFSCLICPIIWIHHEMKVSAFTPSGITNLGDCIARGNSIAHLHSRGETPKMLVLSNLVVIV